MKGSYFVVYAVTRAQAQSQKHTAFVLWGNTVAYLQTNNLDLSESPAPTEKLVGYDKLRGNEMALDEHSIFQCFFSLTFFFPLSNFFQ